MNANVKGLVAILDDDVNLCSFMREVTEWAGFRATVAHDGRDLTLLIDAKPALLLLDLAMPHVDGVEVIRLLAKAGFGGRLVLISGFDPLMLESTKILAELQGVQVAGVLSKPISAKQLKDMLQAAMPAA
jgi:CheY-like chemotaxis protein